MLLDMNPYRLLRYFGIGILIIVCFALLMLGFQFFRTLVVIDTRIPSVDTLPSVAYEDLQSWEQDKIRVRQAFEEHVYGTVPTREIAWQVKKEVLSIEQQSVYELWTLTAPDQSFVFHVVALIPQSTTPVSFVVASNFCPNHLRFPSFAIPAPAHFPSMCAPDPLTSPLSHFIFGRYIDTYPFTQFIEHRTALFSLYLAEGVPDEPGFAPEALERLSRLTDSQVTGTLAAWAWTYQEVARVIEQDSRFSDTGTVLYGHSRDGKAALLAAATSDIPDLVIAHQSGKGGASLWRHAVGEPMADITETYAHWFSPKLNDYLGAEELLPVDQHQLISLIAPRPVLISGAQFDKWGDPQGALVAAHEATGVYALYGASGATAQDLNDFKPADTVAFFMRPWFHGVQPSDWDAFFEFLEQHL